MRQSDGSFVGDEWKEVDTRYTSITKWNKNSKLLQVSIHCGKLPIADGKAAYAPRPRCHYCLHQSVQKLRWCFWVYSWCRISCWSKYESGREEWGEENGIMRKGKQRDLQLAAFCCVAALAILGGLHTLDTDQLGWWLCERQVANGGLNGRPEKKADVSLL